MEPFLASLSPLGRLALALAFTFGAIGLFVALGTVVERTARKRIFDVALRPGQTRRELSSTVRFALFYGIALAVLVERGLLPLTAFAWSSFFITFATSYLAFEIYYYVVHRAMHTRSLLFMHAHHHLSRVNTPLTAFSMSSLETLVWLFGMLGIPALLALVLPFSFEGLIAYLVVHALGNVTGHVNRETVPRAFAHSPLALFAHPVTYHALHHARFHMHYGYGFTLFDRVLRTEWTDWRAVFDRVDGGEALSALDEGATKGTRVARVPEAGAETSAHAS